MRAYPRESQEMEFNAHEKASACFKGVARRGLYDNMRMAVEAVLLGKDRRFNRRCAPPMSHPLLGSGPGRRNEHKPMGSRVAVAGNGVGRLS